MQVFFNFATNAQGNRKSVSARVLLASNWNTCHSEEIVEGSDAVVLVATNHSDKMTYFMSTRLSEPGNLPSLARFLVFAGSWGRVSRS